MANLATIVFFLAFDVVIFMALLATGFHWTAALILTLNMVVVGLAVAAILNFIRS